MLIMKIINHSPIIIFVLSVMWGWLLILPSQAQTEPITPPPFRLPFAEPPSPDTWLTAQPYGNTIGAYYQRRTTYGASGGIHFGLDLSAPCGTELVAMADGIVFAIDGPFGSPPHNLMIDHPQVGYATMYGHLLQPPDLVVGQQVKQGEVIALSGTSGDDCNRRQHLHLEIRDLDHAGKRNPLPLIEANWDNLFLHGSNNRAFMRDLAEPRKWQTLYDQPPARTGGPIVNDFARTWPFDWQAGWRAIIDETPAFTMTAPVTMVAGPFPAIRQLTTGECCTSPYWNAEGSEIRFIDQPAPDLPLGVWGVPIEQAGQPPRLVTQRLGVYNSEGTLMAYPHQGMTIIERVADGESWSINTQGHPLNFTPNGQLLWMVDDAETSWRANQTDIWLSEVDGSNPRRLTTLYRGSPQVWLPNNQVLVTTYQPPTGTLLSTLSLDDGRLTELTYLPRMRDEALSQDRRFLSYMVRQDEDITLNGMWLLDLQDPTLQPKKLPFFGAYRWRDDHRIVYIPFDPAATAHQFYEYNVLSGQSRPLPAADGQPSPLMIANNDWHISPDGRKIALVATQNRQLNGIWVVELSD